MANIRQQETKQDAKERYFLQRNFFISVVLLLIFSLVFSISLILIFYFKEKQLNILITVFSCLFSFLSLLIVILSIMFYIKQENILNKYIVFYDKKEIKKEIKELLLTNKKLKKTKKIERNKEINEQLQQAKLDEFKHLQQEKELELEQHKFNLKNQRNWEEANLEHDQLLREMRKKRQQLEQDFVFINDLNQKPNSNQYQALVLSFAQQLKQLDDKNFYKILAVSENASFEEIKSAYRQKTKQLHLDFNKGLDSTKQISLLNLDFNNINKETEKDE
ncbi:DnaJ domain-containing protein [Mycoplasma capricolum]|uniref:DnaJ domain-containing protein n=1 Tax=Mycoplasma capricolum TaxID=2095 RepID=UPI0022F402F4|nr:DnaJ domain-containing protein [Mycoplasma capricolum]WBX36267.1 DnaJ domain-containing protein [Mycoplasma capricolum subsp. capricolum]